MTNRLASPLRSLGRSLFASALSLLFSSGLALAQGHAFHVATSGSDAGSGSALTPFRTVQRGVDAVAAGDTVLVHGGTYIGAVAIAKSGEAGRPIVLKSAGDGTVILRASLSNVSCANEAPLMERTVSLRQGADYWTLQGLTFDGGLVVYGVNPAALTNQLQNRSLPGRGLYDPAGARTTLESLGSNGADYINVVGNKFTGRGFYAVAARYGTFTDNEVSNVACGTGAGVLLTRFSDGWTVARNSVHDIATSSQHWMSEGIRFTGGSNYNTIQDNVVQRLGGAGRGITMDVNAGWNVIRRNRASYADIGFSEEFGGWGNRWAKNVASDNRSFGFQFATVDANATSPSDRMPHYTKFRCNQSLNNPTGLVIGWAVQSTFSTNILNQVQTRTNMLNYWTRSGNSWEGLSTAPPATGNAVDLTTLSSKCQLD